MAGCSRNLYMYAHQEGAVSRQLSLAIISGKEPFSSQRKIFSQNGAQWMSNRVRSSVPIKNLSSALLHISSKKGRLLYWNANSLSSSYPRVMTTLLQFMSWPFFENYSIAYRILAASMGSSGIKLTPFSPPILRARFMQIELSGIILPVGASTIGIRPPLKSLCHYAFVPRSI